MNKHEIWSLTVLLIVIMICGTLLYLYNNTFNIRFEMDNNTKEAIDSIQFIEWPEPTKKIELYFNIDDNQTIYIKENGTYVEVQLE